jgi:hypothetical protein
VDGMLEGTALDAVIAGLSTALFGALVAGGAYLLKQPLQVRAQVDSLRTAVARLRSVERLLTNAPPETLKSDVNDDAGGAPGS